MPKVKTNRSAAKRFKETSSGKLMAYHSGRGHFLTKKSASRKRKLRKPLIVSGSDIKKLKKLFPGL